MLKRASANSEKGVKFLSLGFPLLDILFVDVGARSLRVSVCFKTATGPYLAARWGSAWSSVSDDRLEWVLSLEESH